MNEHDIHELILKHVCKEIEEIAESIQKNGAMSEQELKRLDMLACRGMEHPEEFEGGSSGMRGRSPMTGRYVSREQGNYEDGYSKGYSEAMNQMNQGNSGHYPMPYYPEPRRW